jgi:hypothetical protein
MTHLQKARWSLIVFTVCLLAVGLSVFPLDAILSRLLPWSQHYFPQAVLTSFLSEIAAAYYYNREHYPFMLYTLDWLGYAHLMIALVFIGPIRDPHRNVWVIEFGQMACLLTLPAIWLFGWLHQLPWQWSLLDCSFGLIGYAVLRYSQRQLQHDAQDGI